MDKIAVLGAGAAGCAAAGGTIGILIPPSISFIIYGILVEESIGRLFIAGILPGIMEIVSYICVIASMAWVFPAWAPSGISYSFKAKIYSLGPIWPVLIIAAVVVGGIYGGIFTPTEAGGIGAAAAFLTIVVNRRMTRKALIASFSASLQREHNA